MSTCTLNPSRTGGWPQARPGQSGMSDVHGTPLAGCQLIYREGRAGVNTSGVGIYIGPGPSWQRSPLTWKQIRSLGAPNMGIWEDAAWIRAELAHRRGWFRTKPVAGMSRAAFHEGVCCSLLRVLPVRLAFLKVHLCTLEARGLRELKKPLSHVRTASNTTRLAHGTARRQPGKLDWRGVGGINRA